MDEWLNLPALGEWLNSAFLLALAAYACTEVGKQMAQPWKERAGAWWGRGLRSAAILCAAGFGVMSGDGLIVGLAGGYLAPTLIWAGRKRIERWGRGG